MSELLKGFVYNKGHQQARETTCEIGRSEGEFLSLWAEFRCVYSIQMKPPQYLRFTEVVEFFFSI